MNTNIIKIYSAHPTTNEYGTIGKSLGYFSNHVDAKIAAKDQGWYSGDGEVVERHAIKDADGKIYLLENITPILLDKDVEERRSDLQKKALSKLSPEEIEALNIKSGK